LFFYSDNINFASESKKEMKSSITTEHIKEARAKYDSYGNEWEKAYFDENSGGFNVYHIKHKFTPTGGGGEAEKTVGNMLAKLGKQVEFLPEGKRKSADLMFDDQKWDIKYINEANIATIRSAIRNARKADNAIFFWDTNEKLIDLCNAANRETGRLLKRQTVFLPDIYYINKNGLLNLLWSKKRD